MQKFSVKKQRSRLRVTSFFVILCLFFIAFPHLFIFIFGPLQQMGVAIGSFFTRSSTMTFEKEENLQTIQEKILLNKLQKENTQLKLLLDFTERQPYTSVTASILSHSISPLQSTFLIDRGEKDGIALGDPVIVADGVLIGRIIKLSSSYAVVRALVDRQSKIAAALLHEQETMGVVEGTMGGFLSMDLIPQDVTLLPGEIIVTSGLETSVPSDLFLGTIAIINKNEQNPFQNATIQPLIDYRSYKIVSVLHIAQEDVSF